MAIDINNTTQLLMAVREMTPVNTFLRDRYFPTNPTTDIFASESVLVDYKEGSKKVAPFVAPQKGGKTLTRKGFHTEQYEPPNIAPQTTLTADDLKKRGFGEAVMSDLAPADRQDMLLLNDLEEMDKAITLREEQMSALCLVDNGYVMKHYIDDKVQEDKKIQFYEGNVNPSVFIPAISWGNANADIISDLFIMAQIRKARGLGASELIIASDVVDCFWNNDKILKMLDNKRVEIGEIKPQHWPEGASLIAKLNCKGHQIDIISYVDTYVDDDDTVKSFIPSGKVVLTSPGCGRMLYGAVTQLEDDKQFHTYSGTRVPKHIVNTDTNSKQVRVTAKPLAVPNQKNHATSAKVLF
jgi:hypothetical protein